MKSPARVRVLVQVCSPVAVDVQRVYLRSGKMSGAAKSGAAPTSGAVPPTAAVDRVVLAATSAEECLSFDVTDGDARLAINVREKRFTTTYFHVRQAGQELSRGFVLLLSLRMEDIQGKYCENLERSFLRVPSPTIMYPGPFQAMSFVAESVELVGEMPVLGAVGDVFEPDQCWGGNGGGIGGGGGEGGGMADLYEDTARDTDSEDVAVSETAAASEFDAFDDAGNDEYDDESDWEPSVDTEPVGSVEL